MTEQNPSDPPPSPPGKKPSDADRMEWHRMAGIGIEFVVAILGVGALGWFLDSRLNSTPWLLITGVGLGFALGLWLLIREAKRAFHD